MSKLLKESKKKKSNLSDQRLDYPCCMYKIKSDTNIYAGSIYPDTFDKIKTSCLYLPVYMPKQNVRIPFEFESSRNIIDKVILYETTINPDLSNCYVYLTVDVRPIKYMKSQRSSKWHIEQIQDEGYIGDAGRTYIVVDKFGPIYIPLKSNFIEYLPVSDVSTFIDQTEQYGKKMSEDGINEIDAYQLYCFDQMYMIKDRVNYFGSEINRKYVKITISKSKFNRSHHSFNMMFKYENWPKITHQHKGTLNQCHFNLE